MVPTTKETQRQYFNYFVFLDKFNPKGGFGGNPHHDPHLLYTLSAVQLLTMFNALDRIDSDKVASCI
jgi:geranylgeranyl transferase type-2 subunit beta